MKITVRTVRKLINEVLISKVYGGYKVSATRQTKSSWIDASDEIGPELFEYGNCLEVFDKYLHLVGLERDDVEIVVKFLTPPYQPSFNLVVGGLRGGIYVRLVEVYSRDVYLYTERGHSEQIPREDFLAVGSLEDLPDEIGAMVFSHAMRSVLSL
jgi:hypothetical protein